MVKKNWKKETARDFLGLSSIIFFLLVVARALIKPYRPFVDQMIIAGIVLLIISFSRSSSSGCEICTEPSWDNRMLVKDIKTSTKLNCILLFIEAFCRVQYTGKTVALC